MSTWRGSQKDSETKSPIGDLAVRISNSRFRSCVSFNACDLRPAIAQADGEPAEGGRMTLGYPGKPALPIP